MSPALSLRWTAIVGLLAAGGALAEEPLVTDRPDFTESARSVSRGQVQLEFGATGADAEDGSEALEAGELLVRWGVARRLEVRFGVPTYVWLHSGEGDESGFRSGSVGLKRQLADGEGEGFFGGAEWAVILASTVPSGDEAFGSDVWQPAAVLTTARDLSQAVSLGVNLGVARPDDEGDRITSCWLSASFGFGLGESTGLFVEAFGFNRTRRYGSAAAVFQTGLTHLVNPDFQLDVRAARRLTDEGPDLLVGIGAAWRYRGKR
jgi:hypothetical protein